MRHHNGKSIFVNNFNEEILNCDFVLGEKPYLCQVCGKAFKTTSNLNQHTVRHQTEKLFACSECPKKFIARNDLVSHYEKHKPKPKIFVCDVCGHGFAKEYRLKKHKIFHTNERRYACEFCDKR